MALILWLNGPFGVGKTSTAEALHRLVPDSFLYDPEDMGAFLVRHLPPDMLHLSGGDYQNHTPWRVCNYEIIAYAAQHYSGVLIVPMTLTNAQYYAETAGKLAKSFPVRQVLLTARREVILQRLCRRGETPDSWPAKQLDRCLIAFQNWSADKILDTSNLSPEETAHQILNELFTSQK